MNGFLAIILSLAFGMTLYGSSQTPFWKTNYQEALVEAQKENKPLLLFFVGSDWSAWSMKMKHEILDTSEFQKAVSEQLICVEVDFPKHRTLSGTESDQNRALKERFAIEEYPRILLIDPTERPIAVLGYVPKTGSNLAADLFHILKQDQHLRENLAQANEHVKVSDLKNWYATAQELGQQDTMRDLIEIGLKTEGKAFFLLEKYRSFITAGKMQEAETLSIRKELIDNDLSLEKAMHYSLALIDFQELAKKEHDLEKVIQPLKDYLALANQESNPNRWRVEMMIAEFYLDSDAWKPALEHAETAFNCAPSDRKQEIQHSLEYMKKRAV